MLAALGKTTGDPGILSFATADAARALDSGLSKCANGHWARYRGVPAKE
jgi:hypothetical protein